jgi:EF-P beta-lysylation protein EpmB
MIPTSAQLLQSEPWKKALANAVKDPAQLLKLLDLPPSLLPAARRAHRLFPLRATHSFIQRMEKQNPDDPLLLQVLPLHAEDQPSPGYCTDPVGDLAAGKVPGLLHKYHGRVLLVATGCCAIHCRYCFRRHFPYSEANATADNWRSALEYIESDPSIGEVILSGGDPLSLHDQKLAGLTRQMSNIGHVKTLRLHTRMPVVLPERVTPSLVRWLETLPFNAVVVIHANHPSEINAQVAEALAQLKSAGVTLLNQAVLLQKINDQPEILVQLSEKLFESAVLPYYLHTLDRVAGAAHFEVALEQAQAIHGKLKEKLPGYLVPKLVTERAGAPNKIVIG